WMIYLGLVAACRYGAMMAVDTLIARLRGRMRLFLLVVIAALSIGILLAMAWYGLDITIRVRFQSLAGIRNPFNGERVSIAWMYAALPVGALLAAVATFAHLLEQIQATLAGQPD
ncbi:MAG TPA: TRAP transporter small permease, partial [Salinisphaeraceae bacterium]|nr:TRAP transporter small permease [Salinisphaeraceae bacterium]